MCATSRAQSLECTSGEINANNLGCTLFTPIKDPSSLQISIHGKSWHIRDTGSEFFQVLELSARGCSIFLDEPFESIIYVIFYGNRIWKALQACLWRAYQWRPGTTLNDTTTSRKTRLHQCYFVPQPCFRCGKCMARQKGSSRSLILLLKMIISPQLPLVLKLCFMRYYAHKVLLDQKDYFVQFVR